MMAKSGLTLSEVARLLGQQQHRLIHLCEKGVVRPDLGEARGRGSSRKFSARNVLEFAVAVKLRDLSVPVVAIAAVVHVLRVFEKSIAKELVDFRLPDILSVEHIQKPSPLTDSPSWVFITVGWYYSPISNTEWKVSSAMLRPQTTTAIFRP